MSGLRNSGAAPGRRRRAGGAGRAGTAHAQWGTPRRSARRRRPRPPPAPPPQGGSRGENFSAGKPPAQLFASDCTGAGCHKGPQGLAKDRGQSGLASFLREHYTNSRESAAALAAYLAGVPGDARAARPDPKRQPRAAARTDEAAKPADDAARSRSRQPASRRSRRAAPSRRPQPRSRRAAGKPRRAGAGAGRGAGAGAEPPAPPPEPPKPQWDIFD